MRSLTAYLCALFFSALVLDGQILTAQYDNARTGATLHEIVLKPANVNSGQFGKVFSLPVDGDVYAQPLYIPQLDVPNKGRHNVLFVATEHGSVYAFDADGQPREPLWRVSFLDAKKGITTLEDRDVRCPFIAPEIGITSTPVIDYPSGTLYVLARTKEGQGMMSSARYVQRLHALAITNGSEKFGGPVEIKAAGFDPVRELSRAALLLANGQVYLTWGSSCDVGPYHGWMMAYDARTLAQTAFFNASPDSTESGIWQSDMGPAADEAGNIYVATGNGKFNLPEGGFSYGDSMLKLRLQGRSLSVTDYFTPFNQRLLNSNDADLGSGGPVLLSHVLLIGGKEGVLYVLDRDGLGKFHTEGDAVLQVYRFSGGIYASPAYWNNHVYILASNSRLTDFAFRDGKLVIPPASIGTQQFGNPGATPAVSANGNKDGIVWLIETKAWNGGDRPAVLRAYDASNVAKELYNSEQNQQRDRAGKTVRFTIPTIVNGRVYVQAKGEIDVYGLLTAR